MTPRQVKRLREKILSEGYYRDRMYEMAELKGDFEADTMVLPNPDPDTDLWHYYPFRRCYKKMVWYAKKINERYEIKDTENETTNPKNN